MAINYKNNNPLTKYSSIENVEDLLENEILNILNKHKFNPPNNTSPTKVNLEAVKTSKERYLPFETDEIRPSAKSNLYSNNYNLKEQIAASIIPIIEEWLNNSLEDIIKAAIEKSINTPDLLDNQEENFKEQNYVKRRTNR